jgi:hypothetical protein
MDRKHEDKMNDSSITVPRNTSHEGPARHCQSSVVHPGLRLKKAMWHPVTRRSTFSTSTYLDDRFPVDWRWPPEGPVSRAEPKRRRRRTRCCAPAISGGAAPDAGGETGRDGPRFDAPQYERPGTCGPSGRARPGRVAGGGVRGGQHVVRIHRGRCSGIRCGVPHDIRRVMAVQGPGPCR